MVELIRMQRCIVSRRTKKRITRSKKDDERKSLSLRSSEMSFSLLLSRCHSESFLVRFSSTSLHRRPIHWLTSYSTTLLLDNWPFPALSLIRVCHIFTFATTMCTPQDYCHCYTSIHAPLYLLYVFDKKKKKKKIFCRFFQIESNSRESLFSPLPIACL